MTWRRVGRPAAVLAAVTVLLITAGVAVAAIPNQGTGYIRGCYQKITGHLRVIAEGQHCKPTEVALDWNQRGPAGPAGPQGPPGESVLRVGVDSFGNPQPGGTQVSVDHPAPGKYVLTFPISLLRDRGTIECAAVASLALLSNGAYNPSSANPPAGEIGTLPAFDPATPNMIADKVVVTTRNSSGALVDRGFWLMLAC